MYFRLHKTFYTVSIYFDLPVCFLFHFSSLLPLLPEQHLFTFPLTLQVCWGPFLPIEFVCKVFAFASGSELKPVGCRPVLSCGVDAPSWDGRPPSAAGPGLCSALSSCARCAALFAATPLPSVILLEAVAGWFSSLGKFSATVC